MARIRRKKLWPISVSPTMAAEVLGVRLAWLKQQLAANRLTAYVLDGHAKILVEDLVAFVRSHPIKH